MKHSKTHLGFKAIQNKIAQQPGIRNAGAVLAAKTRATSPQAQGEKSRAEKSQRLMSDLSLVSPFPSSDLPAVFRWLEPFRYQTAHCEETIEQFVRGEMERQERLITWGITKGDELGGYAECEVLDRVGMMNLIFKRSFFKDDVAQPALRMVLADAFERGLEILIFEPGLRARSVKRLFREVGARECGMLDAEEGKPERMAMALTLGDWHFEERLHWNAA